MDYMKAITEALAATPLTDLCVHLSDLHCLSADGKLPPELEQHVQGCSLCLSVVDAAIRQKRLDQEFLYYLHLLRSV